MFTALHVCIALSSLVYAAYLFFAPSYAGLRITYGLIAATFVTGIGLVFLDPGNLPQVCTTGLVYLAVMLSGVAYIRGKILKLNPVPER